MVAEDCRCAEKTARSQQNEPRDQGMTLMTVALMVRPLGAS